MAAQETGGFCKRCKRNVMIRRAGTSHILHLLMSIITAGLWLVVWILSSIKIGGWRCSVCGSSSVSTFQRSEKALQRLENPVNDETVFDAGLWLSLLIIGVFIYVGVTALF